MELPCVHLIPIASTRLDHISVNAVPDSVTTGPTTLATVRCFLFLFFYRRQAVPYFSGNFSNDDGDGDGKEAVKKLIGLITKTTTLHVYYTFW